MTEGFAIGGVQKKWKTTANNASSSNISTTSSHSNSSGNAQKAKSYGQEEAVTSPLQAAKSFVLNEDMLKIRQAEQVILAEEERFGAFCRDPEGRLMPELQVRSFNTHL